MTKPFPIVTAALAVAACGCAQDLGDLPRNEPAQIVSGTIRVWGNGRMESVVKSFQAGFRSHHPDVRFETRLMGTGTAMAGLYTSVADVAFMGRAGTAKEIMAFEWVFRY